jgi:hypothetical protein
MAYAFAEVCLDQRKKQQVREAILALPSALQTML